MECQVSSRSKIVYVLAHKSSRAWTRIPTVPERSACYSFYMFLYGEPVESELTVLRDSNTHYIIVADPAYANTQVMETGKPFIMPAKYNLLLTVRKALSAYREFAHEASGTVGEVFSMTRHGTKYVAKLQVLQSARDRLRFEREVEMQTKFARERLGLVPIDYEIVEQVGVLVMPFVQTLNAYLHTKRARSELERVVDELVALLLKMQDQELTHGDLAFFNVFVDGSHLGTMDFDRASSRVFMPEVDVLRAATELTASTRSKGGLKMHAANNRFLSTKGLQRFKEVFSLEGSPSELDQQWENAYLNYCERAQVQCL